MGARELAAGLDFSGILDEDVESRLKDAAVVSMGTEISVEDLGHIASLCDQVVELSEYRAQLYEYLKNRMQV
jgi:nucleolar protein 58